MPSNVSVFKVIPTTQQYDWGKPGNSSKVAQFAAASQIPGFVIDEESPYAELWMGTHPKSPSHLRSSNEVLAEYLASHPELIGQEIIDKFDASNGNLPFLFKVLSIDKALSIQTHPDKKTAEILHAERPDIYKDPNHKPEMALAITPFEALCGFRPLTDIAEYLNSTPELSSLISTPIVARFLALAHSSTPTGSEEKLALKELFATLMTADPAVIKTRLETLVSRYNAEGHVDNDVSRLVLKLNTQFPGDVGVFCAFVLNYIILQPGEAIFLGAGEPHAYISGECIECMANSDNVIRAGLTPKLRDIPNLVAGLTYAAAPPTKHTVTPTPFLPSSSSSSTPTVSTLYDPPIPEFSVVQTKLPAGAAEAHPGVHGPSLAIVTGGLGRVIWGAEKMDVGLGDVFFIGAGTSITLHAGSEELVVYRAFVEA